MSNKKKCKYCMSEMEEKAKRCPNCRKRQNKGNIALVLSLSIGIPIVLALLIIPIVINSNKQNEERKKELANKSYYAKVSDFNIAYLTNCAAFEGIVNDIKSYGHDSIGENKYNGDINEAIAQALADNEEVIGQVKDNKSKMSKYYNDIMYSDCYSIYCEDIEKNVKEAYSTYLEFYDLAVSPSGNFNTYSDNFSKIDAESIKYYNSINDLLELFR